MRAYSDRTGLLLEDENPLVPLTLTSEGDIVKGGGEEEALENSKAVADDNGEGMD